MEVYRRPATMFVAGFVGSPAMNFLPGEIGQSGAWIGPAGWSLAPGAAGRAGVGSAVTLGVRPHDLAITAPGQGAASARVDVVEPRGSELLVHLRLGAEGAGQEIRVVSPPEPLPAVDSVVGLRVQPQQLHWFDTQTGRRIDPASP